MRVKLEAIANVAVILVALAVGYVVLGRYVAAYRTPRSVSAGDLLPAIPSLDWSQHRHTLVLALNTGCHFCQDSVPFYQKLAAVERPDRDPLEIVAVFPNTPEAVRQLMRDEGLSIRSIPGVPPAKLGVAGYPTLLLLNREGRVERSWAGLLTPRQELDVLTIVTGSAQNCSASELSALSVGDGKSCGSDTNDQTKN